MSTDIPECVTVIDLFAQFVPILLVLSTSSMLLLDQRTLQIKYRVPATEIYRLSLSPYLDNIAVFHVKAVSLLSNKLFETAEEDGQPLSLSFDTLLSSQNSKLVCRTRIVSHICCLNLISTLLPCIWFHLKQ